MFPFADPLNHSHHLSIAEVGSTPQRVAVTTVHATKQVSAPIELPTDIDFAWWDRRIVA